MKYVDMVLHESAANAGFECLAKVCEGCGKENFVVKIALASRPGCAGTSRSLLCAFQERRSRGVDLCGNGGLTFSHFVQCGVIFVLVMVSFHRYFEPGSLLEFGPFGGQNIECWCKSYASVT